MVEVRLISLLYYAAISKEEWKMMSGKVNASINNEDWYYKIMNHNNYELLFNKKYQQRGHYENSNQSCGCFWWNYMLVSIMERGQAEKHKSSINTKMNCIWNKDSFPWSAEILAYFLFEKSTPIPKFNVLPALWYKTESTVS